MARGGNGQGAVLEVRPDLQTQIDILASRIDSLEKREAAREQNGAEMMKRLREAMENEGPLGLLKAVMEIGKQNCGQTEIG
jgi:hypothetical protein